MSYSYYNYCDNCYKELKENVTWLEGLWKFEGEYHKGILCEDCVRNLKNCFVIENRCFSIDDRLGDTIPYKIGMCLACNICQSILHNSGEFTFQNTIVPYLPKLTKKKIFTLYLCEKVIRLRYLAEKNTVLKRFIFSKIILLLCENFEF